MSATLKDIAKQIGVADATVSMALRNHPRISATRRRQIQQVAQAMGYRPNPLGRALKSGKSMSIGVAIGSVNVPVHHPKLRTIETLARQHGYWPYMVTIGNLPPAALITLITDLLSRCLDGIIVYHTHPLPDSAVRLLRQSPTPVVYLNWVPPGERHSVALNVQPGITQLAEHLAALGHRRVFLFRTFSEVNYPSHRAEPYQRALEAAGIEVVSDERMVLQPQPDGEFGAPAYHRVRELLLSGDRPTALVMTNDETATSAMAAAQDVGLRVPEDISVVGFDDLPYTRFIRPALTTIQQPREPMGEAAFQMLLKLMNDPAAKVEPVTFETELVVRQSTGSAPKTSGIKSASFR